MLKANPDHAKNLKAFLYVKLKAAKTSFKRKNVASPLPHKKDRGHIICAHPSDSNSRY